jgi:hypothetical protein
MTHHLHRGQSVVAPVEVWDGGAHDGEGEWVPATAADNVTVTASNPELTSAQVMQDGDVKVLKLTNSGSADAKGATVTVHSGTDQHIMNLNLGKPSHGDVRVNMAAAKDAPERDPNAPPAPHPAPQLNDGNNSHPSTDHAPPRTNDADAGGVKP